LIDGRHYRTVGCIGLLAPVYGKCIEFQIF